MWVLVILATVGGSSVSTATFNTIEGCQNAAQTIKTNHPAYDAFCVEDSNRLRKHH